MLSYRHAFHAGNHADVIKHVTLIETIFYALQKEKPIHYIDTHAGAGLYHLESDYAKKNAEFNTGIMPIMQAKVTSEALQRYQACVQFFNGQNKLHYYPGSPSIAAYLLREHDPLHLFELHPTDVKLLQSNAEQWQSQGKKCHVQFKNGFQGIKALLPPVSRRGIILIDPPYEQKQDYLTVVSALQEGLKRFATGTFLVWYPCLHRPEPEDMLRRIDILLNELGLSEKCLHATLFHTSPESVENGMFGSGMIIINPAWTLQASLSQALAEASKLISPHAYFRVETTLT